MKPEYYHHVADPEIVGQPGSPNAILRFQTVETQQGQSRRSGKHIHLELTNESAMRLLAVLKLYQNHLGLPDDPTPPIRTDVPPAKDRH
jgi:hypothetical protein